MAYSGARETLIFEKNLKSKISCQTPFNTPTSLRLLISYFGIITFWKSYISKVLGLVMLHLVTNTLCYATFCRSTETKFTFWQSYISKVLGLVMVHLVTNTLCYATFCRSTETKFIKTLIANCCAHGISVALSFAQFAQKKV